MSKDDKYNVSYLKCDVNTKNQIPIFSLLFCCQDVHRFCHYFHFDRPHAIKSISFVLFFPSSIISLSSTRVLASLKPIH